MTKPQALIMTGYGINCEEETAFGFEKAGAESKIVHINDLIEKNDQLKNYQILAFPGGFAYGDDTGAGKAFANRVRHHLMEKMLDFVKKDKLVIGICNGFQIISNLGLVPAFESHYDSQKVALTRNVDGRYLSRWVDLKVQNKTPWLKGIKSLSLPIGHGEGNFYADPKTLKKLQQKNLIALRYVRGEICEYQNMTENPNGAIENIAGITDETGHVLGLMPHPDRALFFTQRPDWPLQKEKLKRKGKKLPCEGPGMRIFKNAITYFS
ncbi:phosphoribosylformylglycinamidine synthase I [Candidatus Peregrinibacteria bacterium]|nr:phosphoribosylformylglycinamidine synthase I [Candidatus Peregrinibacteria bacterium]